MLVRIILSMLLSISSAAVLAEATKPIVLADDAPDQHVVVKGDTLWGISGKFLRDPWRWPEVWRLNREEIRNPHLIYPGQVVILDRSGGTPVLKLGAQLNKVDPKIYSDPSREPIASIPQGLIEPYLSQPMIMDADGLARAPKIVAVRDNRVLVGPGAEIYAAGIDPAHKLWQIFRPLKPVVDPETGAVLGYEAFFVGTARLIREGEPATLQIASAKQEIGQTDRLVPVVKPDVITYAPRAPDKDIRGRIVEIYGGLTHVGETGRGYIVTLNRGTRDGLEVGHVLALYRNGAVVDYRETITSKPQMYKLPDERSGLVFVFRTFDRVSYALVVNSSGPVQSDDLVRTP